MGIIQEEFFDMLLEIIPLEPLLHAGQQFLIAKGILRPAVIEPGLQGGQAVDEALGGGAEISLPQAEFQAVDARPEELAADALLADLRQGIPNHPEELLLLILLLPSNLSNTS